jgi:hypothetical protein
MHGESEPTYSLFFVGITGVFIIVILYYVHAIVV